MPSMDSVARFDPERYTAVFASFGIVALAIAFHFPIALLPALACFTLACLADTRKLYLFGPFLDHELRGMTRRVRNHLWWPLIALLASVPVIGLHLVVTQLPAESSPPPNVVPLIAAGGFLFVFWILLILTFSLASTYLCYGIAEDRESKRLDFQLVTDLRGRELVIGKMLARLVAVLMYPLAAVPVILTMPFLFRMDPAIIVYAFAYGGAMLVSLSGLSALGSVLAATKKSSGNWMALFVMPYLFLVFLLSLLRFWPEVWMFPGSPGQPTRYCLGDLVEIIAIGNPLTLLVRWASVGLGIGNLDLIASDFPWFASFHVLAGGFAFLLAARKVRHATANSGAVENPTGEDDQANSRPPVDDEPVRWKEIHCNPLLVKAQKVRIVNLIASILFVILPATLFTAAAVSNLGGYREFVVEVLARFAPIIIVSISIISVQNLSLHSVAREREKDTLLNLLLSDLSAEEILRQKLQGILKLGRGMVYWLLIVGIPAVLCGSYYWWAFAGLLLFQCVFMFLMAALGLFISASATNVQSAAKRFGLMILVTVFVLSVVLGVAAALAAQLDILKATSFLTIGLFPPFGLVAPGLAKHAPAGDWPYWIAGYLVGLAVYAVMARWIWIRALRRFAAACDGSSDRGPLLDNRTQ